MPQNNTTPRKLTTTRNSQAHPSTGLAKAAAPTQQANRVPHDNRPASVRGGETPAPDRLDETAERNQAGAAQLTHSESPAHGASGEGQEDGQHRSRQHSNSQADGPGETLFDDPGETHGRDDSIAAVGRALDLLEALARVGPAPLTLLAEAAGCTRAAAFRLLRTLQARGFALQDEARGVWRLGARWSVLGRAAAQQGALAATAMPFLAALGKTTGENAYLIVRDGLESETVAIYQADPSLRLYSEIGKRRTLHAGPSRLLLTHAPEAVQTQVLAQRLPRLTPATRTDAAWIAADLQRIRARGYLLTADEEEAGAVSITGPVRDASGHVVAALSITAASMRMRPPRPRALLPLVLDAAARLSQALGQPTAGLPPAKKNGVATDPVGIQDWEPPVAGFAAPGPHSIFR
jgi:IclR family KDG regulon transcriptional repressor